MNDWLCHKPVLVAFSGSIPWVVHDRKGEELVPLGNIEDMAGKTINLGCDPLTYDHLDNYDYRFVMAIYIGNVIAEGLIKSDSICIIR